MPDTNDSASPLAIEPSILDCLNDDVLQLICASLHDQDEAQKQQHIRAQDKASLKALSTTCKRLRRFCIPYIFLTFKLACYGENPWADAMKKLEGWNSEFARFVREIDISIIHHDPFWRKEVSSLFIDTLPEKLTQALLVMASASRRLERFAMTVDDNHLDFFVDALIKHNVVFPTVRRLSIGYCDGNFIDLFPNTVALAVHGLLKYMEDMPGSRTDLLKALPRLPKLERFYFDQFVYRDELLDTLLKAIPKIKTLVLPSGTWTSFEEYVSQLSRFRFVEVLGVADSADLNVGFRPPRCGNAYRGPRGAELRERVRKEGENADKRVGLAFFSQYPQLKELWLGTYCPRIATAKRDSRGAAADLEWSQSTATYPWSDVF